MNQGETPIRRVMADSNIILSSLLSGGNRQSPPARIMDLALTGTFELIVPEQLRNEIWRAAAKPKLQHRLGEQQLSRLSQIFDLIENPVERNTDSFHLRVRDEKDQFLLELAIRHEVDYLVSGDGDVLVLAFLIDQPQIVSPAEFLNLTLT
jgi:putative PIN family toxin of toxin-antitoxin system